MYLTYQLPLKRRFGLTPLSYFSEFCWMVSILCCQYPLPNRRKHSDYSTNSTTERKLRSKTSKCSLVTLTSSTWRLSPVAHSQGACTQNTQVCRESSSHTIISAWMLNLNLTAKCGTRFYYIIGIWQFVDQ